MARCYRFFNSIRFGENPFLPSSFSRAKFVSSPLSLADRSGFLMIGKRELPGSGDSERTPKRSKKSWKAVKKALKYYEQGKYDDAFPLLLRYQDTEAKALFLLSCMHWNGQGTSEDTKTGISYLQKLLKFRDIRPEDNHLLAMALYNIGDLYYRGLGLAKDDSETERHWRMGALMDKDPETLAPYLGTTKCQSALGMFFSDPTRNHPERAFFWHQKAAQAGCIISEAAVGVMYMYGIGTEENLESAYQHLTTAAVLGNVYAKGYLAAFYYRQQLYPKTVCLGKELAEYQDYALLAEQNDCSVEHVRQGVAVGCFYLALCSQYGYNTEKNIPEAKALIKRALEISTDIAVDLHEKAILGIA